MPLCCVTVSSCAVAAAAKRRTCGPQLLAELSSAGSVISRDQDVSGCTVNCAEVRRSAYRISRAKTSDNDMDVVIRRDKAR